MHVFKNAMWNANVPKPWLVVDGNKMIAQYDTENEANAHIKRALGIHEVSQLGISNGVWKSMIMKRYIPRCCGSGYIGNSKRTKLRDKIVEAALASQGLGTEGIAFWLTSISGRHMMDSVTARTSAKQFSDIVQEATSTAAEDVAIWSHPDYSGMLGSTPALKRHLRTVFGKCG